MATLIGVVSQVVGEVYAVAGDGTRRPLVEGDRVFAGEQLVTGSGGAVAVTLTNGEVLTLGRDSSLGLNEQMLAGGDGQAAQPQDQASTPPAPSDGDLTDVEQLQAAIEAGVDPTQAGEATAAGPGAGGGAGGAGGAGGGHSFVLLGEIGGALDPVIGFPTAGFNTGPEFPDPEPIVTDEPAADSTPSIEVEYEDASGAIVVGPAIVDEEALADGTNPGSGAEQASGSIIITSPDGVSSLQIQGFDGVWVDVTNGGVVVGQYGTLTVDAAGNWTYTLTDNTLDHPNASASGAADQVGESFPVRVFDLDGDVSPTVQLNVLVNDDAPILTEGEGAQVAAIVDEDETSDGITDGDSVTNVAAGGPGTLNALVNFGADGIGSFGLTGSPSAIASLEAQGLTSGGTALSYGVAGNVLTASAGGETIFTLQVGADGSFTFTLVGQLDHPTADGNDDELLELPIDFSGVLTAVDGDGDSVGTFTGGSFVIDVEDDVPQLVSRGEGEEQIFPSVNDLVHEDALSTGDGAPHDGNAEGGQTTTASGPAGSLSALVDFGADGPGDFGLSSDLSSMDLQGLTSAGVALTYGVVGNVLTASAGGETIFTLTVNADGSWEFVLQGPIDHPVADGAFDSEDLPGLGVDFSGILTATDGDGDPLVGGFPGGSFAIDIEDDVPVLAGGDGEGIAGLVHEDALTVGAGAPHEGNPEGGQTTTVGSATAGSLSGLVSFGGDGPGSFGLSSDLSSMDLQGLTSGGAALTYGLAGNVLTASAGGETIFTLTVNGDGSWEFVLEGPLDHPIPDGDLDGELLPGLGIDFSGVLTATDGDGDPLAGGFPAGSFTVNVEDDVPRPDGEERDQILHEVQEDALTLGGGAPYEGNDEGGQTTVASGDAGDLFALIDFGADGPGSVGLSDDTSSLEAQDLMSEGTELSYAVVGNVLTASANGNTIFTLTVNGDGSYEFVLSGPLDHPIADSALDDETLAGLGIDFSQMITATDGDGDPMAVNLPNGSFAIDVEDDVPVAREFSQRPWVSNQVDEDELAGGISDGDGVNTVASGGAGALHAAINFGADGPGSVGLSGSPAAIATLEAQGLTSGGVALSYTVVGNLLTAMAGADTIFTLQVNGDGSYTFTLSGPLDHPIADGTPAGDNEQLGSPIDFSALITATDGDGDPLSGLNPGSFVIQVEDDIPVAVPPQYDNEQNPIALVMGEVDEDELSGGISDGDSEGTSVSGGVGTLNALVNFGADGPGDFGLSDDPLDIATLEAQGLTSDATPLSYAVVGNVLTATAGGNPIFTLTVNADGSYDFQLQGPLDHPLPGSTDDDQLLGLPIDFSGVLTATDGDGDPVDGFADGSFVINVEDDVPEAQDDSATVLAGQTQDVNLVFVLDFSGSISDVELDQMLDAVRTAGQELFNTATGAVQIQIVAFSGTSVSFPTIDNIADFTTLVNSLNPAEGGTRPVHSTTDFTDAIQETMSAYTPLPGWSNQVIFISDGNPNEQTGPGGAPSLTEPTATDWNNFVDSNGINVTTIGIGNDIDDARLEDIDVDAGANNDPLRVDDFDDLVDTLVDQVIGGLVSGNVLLGDNNAVGGGDDDAYGADGPGQILSIEIDGNLYTWDGTADGDEQLSDILTAAGGKLSFNFATGAWSYQAPAQLNGDETESFEYTIVDNDGDPSTATLTIHVEDIGPVEGFVDEDNLPTGIDDLDAVTDVATGSVAPLVVGPDAGSHFTLSADTSGITPATSGGVALVYSVLGNTLTATAGPGGQTVFTLQVLDDGSYTFNLEKALDHPADASDDDQLLTLDFTSILQANDGSDPLVLAGNFLIHVEDDIPLIDAGLSGQQPVALNTQDAETIGVNFDSASSNFSGAFSANANHGADGPGTVTWSYSMVLLVAEGSLSGLSSDGDAIRLYQTPGGTIIGSTAGSEGAISGSNTIFTLSVNGSGVVTLNQYQEIDHALPGVSSNYDAQEALLGSNLVGLQGTATITDYDQDTHSDSVTLDLGGKVAFDDHGPSISLGFGQHSDVLNTQDAQTIGGASDSDTDAFAGAFSITSQSYGADGAGSVSSSYALTMIAAEGTSSGLSSEGATVYLYEVGGVIYGSTSASELGVDPSNTIFTLSVNAATGQVTLTQFEEIDHSGPGVGSNYSAQEAVLGSGLVGLKGTVVITDGDGDTASADKTLDLGGKVAFDDDGPSITLGFGTAPAPTLNTQDSQTKGSDTDTDTDTGSFGGALVVSSFDHGADGPGTITQSYSLNLLSGGGNGPLASGMNSAAGPIYLYKIGGEIVGSSSATLIGVSVSNTVFSLSVDSSNGQVTLSQFQEIFHDAPGSSSNYSNQEEILLAGKIGLTLTATITDGDGDFATADKTLDLGGKIAFDDDGPSTSANPGVQLDDDALAGGIAGGPGGTDDANSVNTTGTLNHDFGADGAGTVKWLGSGAPGGFTYEASPDGSQLLVKQGGTTVLTLTLNTATGAYTVTQNAPIQHDNADLENNQSFTLSYQVTDKDGDTATGSLSVNVDDDTPVAQNDTAIVAESSGKDFNVAFVLDSSGSISNTEFATMMEAVRAAGEALFNGTDGSVQITIVAFSTGATSYAAVSSLAAFDALVDDILDNRPFNGNTNFTAAVEETMDVYDPIPGWSNQVFFISDGNPNVDTEPDNSLEDVTAAAWNTFIDSNGINVTTIGVGDGINGPRLQDVDLDGSGAPILVTDFDDLIDTLLDQISGNVVSGNVLLGNDNALGGGDDDAYGADGAGRVLSIEIDGVTYTWNGVGTIAVSSGGSIAGSQLTNIVTDLGGKLSFNFTNGTWSYTAPQSVASDTSESFDYVIIDKDGDPSQATLTVNIEDAAPVIGKVDEDELPGGITDGDAQTTVATGSLTELLIGNGPATFGLHSSPAFLPSLTSDGVAVTYNVVGNTLTAMAGAATIFTLVVQANGAYTFTLTGPLDHPLANGDDNEILTLNLTEAIKATNGGNPVPLAGDLLIQVEDDVPAILATSNLVYSNSSNPGGATGVFDYSTGADTRGTGPFSASDSDFKSVTLTGSVGGVAISSQSVTWVSENATTATFDIEFEYAPNPSNPGVKEQAEGTLTFDKVNGTYTVTLDGPIEGFQVLKTSATLGITGYEPNSSTVDGTNPVVAVSQLASDFFVQFRSYAETGGGTGVNNLQTGGASTTAFVNGETFTQASSYVTLSNDANGVAGDTIGKGEVLDLNFYTTNPTGNLGVTPTGRADGIFLKFDGINNEDLVIVLKLVGAGGVTTTRALVVSNSDIYRNFSGPTALAALAVYGITLDNNDGAIVIESNDFNGAGESWQIYGAQVLTSVEGITTSVAINYDRDFNDGFDNLTNFDDQTDNDVVKVSDIGFIKTQTTTVDAELDFQVAVQDADNDATSSVNLHVTIEAGNTFTGTALADVMQGSAGNDTLSGLAGDDVLIGGLGNDLLIGGADNDTYQWTAGNTGTDTVQGFVANFNGNAQGDRLDLSQLLTGEHGQAGDIGNLLSFIDISTANLGGGVALDTVIKVSDTAAGDPATSTEQTIVLQDVNLVALYGGTESGAILGMLGDGTLKVDVA
jgi:T1SS-143 domain-containing protein